MEVWAEMRFPCLGSTYFFLVFRRSLFFPSPEGTGGGAIGQNIYPWSQKVYFCHEFIRRIFVSTVGRIKELIQSWRHQFIFMLFSGAPLLQFLVLELFLCNQQSRQKTQKMVCLFVIFHVNSCEEYLLDRLPQEGDVVRRNW